MEVGTCFRTKKSIFNLLEEIFGFVLFQKVHFVMEHSKWCALDLNFSQFYKHVKFMFMDGWVDGRTDKVFMSFNTEKNLQPHQGEIRKVKSAFYSSKKKKFNYY